MPLAVGTRLPIVDYGRPAQRKVTKTKDKTQLVVVQALRTIANPKCGPLGVAKVAPLPAFLVPKAFVSVTTSPDKLKVLAIRNGILAGTKRRYINKQPAILNIPTIRGKMAFFADDNLAGADLDHGVLRIKSAFGTNGVVSSGPSGRLQNQSQR
jgi:hypothetical protein